MNCPSCNRAIHFSSSRSLSAYLDEPFEDHHRYTDYGRGIGTVEGFCPACYQFIVILCEGNYNMQSKTLGEGKDTIIYPQHRSPKTLPPEIPENYKVDFYEAYLVSEISPKASAALSRRLLQSILQNKFGIKRKDLSQEIDEFIKRSDVPPYIANAVDAIRMVGNFAAHPLKYTNTNEIVDVEPDEAQWLITVLEALFEFAFIEPERVAKQKLALNQKLTALGKPSLKSYVE